LVDKKLNKNNNIELDSQNCHAEQLIIGPRDSNIEQGRNLKNLKSP